MLEENTEGGPGGQGSEQLQRAFFPPPEGTGEAVADAVSFFCSPRSGFVSGQVLYVAGGPRT